MTTKAKDVKPGIPEAPKPHVCAFTEKTPSSEIEIKGPHFREGKWQAHTSAAFLCKCGNSQNLTMVYTFKASDIP